MGTRNFEDEPPMVAGDKAMNREASPRKLGDFTLNIFSGRRVAAASALGMKFIQFTPEEWRKLITKGASGYDGIEYDVSIYCFLCAHSNETAIEIVTGDLKESAAKVLDWAEEAEVIYGGKNFVQARHAFWDSMLAIATNTMAQEAPLNDDGSEPAKKKVRTK